MSLSFGYGSVLVDAVTLNNFTSPTVVYESDKAQTGKTIILRDLGVIFTTSGGTVNFSKRMASGSLVRITGDATGNDERLAHVSFSEGESLALVLTSDGVGIVTILGDSEIKDNYPPSFFERPIVSQLFRRGGF